MKLLGTIAVHVKGEAILRRPGLWERIRKAFGGDPDLRTGRMKASLEAEAVVDAVRDALRGIGVTNAVSLVIDELVLFQDKEGRDDDLGDLFLAFHEQSSALGGGFGVLRLAVEHVEAGLHLVVEVQARTEHAASEPAVRVVVSGRIADLEPRRGEDAAAYRARVEPLTRDRGLVDVSTAQFESFVDRVKGAIAAAMPEARVETRKAQAQIVRPSDKAPVAHQPGDRNYDPYVAYYPSPMYSVLDTMMWMSIFSMWSHPHVHVVNYQGDTVGTADNPAAETAPDPTPAEAGGDAGGDQGGDGQDAAGDHGGGHDGDAGSDLGGDAGVGDSAVDVGGDVGGGDFGGGDFGGFD